MKLQIKKSYLISLGLGILGAAVVMFSALKFQFFGLFLENFGIFLTSSFPSLDIYSFEIPGFVVYLICLPFILLNNAFSIFIQELKASAHKPSFSFLWE
ncbi:hypothetical protein A3A20_01990 [Candidatus Wolfebacteria bacterium RIFCSPLOWO2_01_FULL_45_19]|uniref:Uncharacterized protein n=1 Tax=Candidatus Wolfebacteria bacterium RIFCSPLOWO2_01_FULL_45_19 TaxID=1802557 RepID=A0A1F8DV58_9BACT|nr:MAG: hypothetical protein A3A20_01990 [Candidatus Wolfebacteria bacterium RIFCSPLOWO2_01_FULL_45_19]